MKLFSVSKDGGPDSNVTAFWLCEFKGLFSIALLRFSHGTRDAYHSHAFNCVSWLLKGGLDEQLLDGGYNFLGVNRYRPSFRPIKTLRETFHRVYSNGTSWVLTFRGPWKKNWEEFDPRTLTFSRLANGRKVEWTSRLCPLACGKEDLHLIPPPPIDE